jgi:DNA repair exonuclease SbcCD ATPase subunit
LSETTKLRLDLSANDEERQSRTSDDIGPIDEAESQMRKALGLLGDTPRHQVEPERSQRLGRPSSNLGPSGGGLQRRRFVQDGDVPVTVLRREQAHNPIPQRAALSGVAPASSRLQRVEAAQAAEGAARETAERSLRETQTAVRDLQTKIGHADLAKNEAIDALQREREANAQARTELESLQTELQMLRGDSGKCPTC